MDRNQYLQSLPMQYTLTDTQRLDLLERMLGQRRYTGRAVLRWSTSGRGMRLHETGAHDPEDAGVRPSIRRAIDAFAKEHPEV